GLLNNPHVRLVEVDQPRFLMSFSDDAGNPMTQQVTPYAVKQSNVNDISFNASAGMKVCVIDSGLDRSNPDFVWNNIDGDNDSGTGSWDQNGGPHGTHVAGTIGAADNSIGVVGMAPGVDMHIIKVFNADGWGDSSDLAHAANLCSQAGANIISMSLGGGGSNSTESNAFQSFSDAGGLVVAAAGNDGNSVRSYPAGYPSVMMV
ncbi:S8 family serine peptidase, partial [Shewanella sp. 0m-11]